MFCCLVRFHHVGILLILTVFWIYIYFRYGSKPRKNLNSVADEEDEESVHAMSPLNSTTVTNDSPTPAAPSYSSPTPAAASNYSPAPAGLSVPASTASGRWSPTPSHESFPNKSGAYTSSFPPPSSSPSPPPPQGPFYGLNPSPVASPSSYSPNPSAPPVNAFNADAVEDSPPSYSQLFPSTDAASASASASVPYAPSPPDLPYPISPVGFTTPSAPKE